MFTWNDLSIIINQMTTQQKNMPAMYYTDEVFGISNLSDGNCYLYDYEGLDDDEN